MTKMRIVRKASRRPIPPKPDHYWTWWSVSENRIKRCPVREPKEQWIDIVRGNRQRLMAKRQILKQITVCQCAMAEFTSALSEAITPLADAMSEVLKE